MKNASEKLEVYDLDDNLFGLEERDVFYSNAKKEFQEKGSVSKKVKTIRLLLMNSQGRIYLQKRSNIKKENPGLYDKSVGGHVTAGHTYDLSAIKECAEELGFPASVLSDNEFVQAAQSVDLTILGILKKVDFISQFDSERVSEDGTVIQPYMTAIYIGYYDGALRFADGESSGIEVFSLDELVREISEKPEKFTEDLKFMIDNYKENCKSIS